jgi:hypothetical protein
LARYYRYHLKNLASVDTSLIRTMGTVETALPISHPGYFDMSMTDMDQDVASLHEKEMDMEIDNSTASIDETVAHDDPTFVGQYTVWCIPLVQLYSRHYYYIRRRVLVTRHNLSDQ